MDIMYSALANPTVCHIKTSGSIARQEVPADVGLERDSDVPVRESTENATYGLPMNRGFRLTTSRHLSSKIKRFFGADCPELEPLVIRDRPKKRFISQERFKKFGKRFRAAFYQSMHYMAAGMANMSTIYMVYTNVPNHVYYHYDYNDHHFPSSGERRFGY